MNHVQTPIHAKRRVLSIRDTVYSHLPESNSYRREIPDLQKRVVWSEGDLTENSLSLLPRIVTFSTLLKAQPLSSRWANLVMSILQSLAKRSRSKERECTSPKTAWSSLDSSLAPIEIVWISGTSRKS